MKGNADLVSNFQAGEIHECGVENDTLGIADLGYCFGHDVILCFTSWRLSMLSPFGLDLFEQFGVGSFKLVSKVHSGFQSLGINLELSSQSLGSWIVKKRNVLAKIRHNQLVT